MQDFILCKLRKKIRGYEGKSYNKGEETNKMDLA